MILQSLSALYEVLVASGTLDQPGWSPVKVSWGLELDVDGQLKCVVPLRNEDQNGNRIDYTPQEFSLPLAASRTSLQCNSCFLWDNSKYILGINNNESIEALQKKFNAAKELHVRLLENVNHPAARAVCRFFSNWVPLSASEHPKLQGYYQDIQNGNITFCYKGVFVYTIDEIKCAWNKEYHRKIEDTPRMKCLVTGKQMSIARLHPKIKGVNGANSVGANLVSFNCPALDSYGRDGEQGLNAPVSTQAAFAYGAALNYLLADRNHHLRMGDTTVVYWAEDGAEAYSDFISCLFDSSTMDDDTLKDALIHIAKGKNANWNNMQLNPENRFYILGLAPNAARLSVRFFLSNTFGNLMKNVVRHQKDLEIVKPSNDTWNELSLWWLLNETVNQKARDKQPHPQMAGDMARAIWQGTPYPATIFEQTQIRIRAERKVTRGRAAIIKAYLLRQPNYTNKEVLTVQLNEDTNYAPYLLGRLFSVLEALQEKANPNINTTIRDRYFSSACATPSIIFPTLIRLAQVHLKKLDQRWRIYFDKQISQILAEMDNGYPARLNLQDQGVFQLGYYHQTQKRFTKKEDENNG